MPEIMLSEAELKARVLDLFEGATPAKTKPVQVTVIHNLSDTPLEYNRVLEDGSKYDGGIIAPGGNAIIHSTGEINHMDMGKISSTYQAIKAIEGEIPDKVSEAITAAGLPSDKIHVTGTAWKKERIDQLIRLPEAPGESVTYAMMKDWARDGNPEKTTAVPGDVIVNNKGEFYFNKAVGGTLGNFNLEETGESILDNLDKIMVVDFASLMACREKPAQAGGFAGVMIPDSGGDGSTNDCAHKVM